MKNTSSKLKQRIVSVVMTTGIVAVAAGIPIAFAALTFSGTGITGDASTTIDATGTISIGASQATTIMIGRSGIAPLFPGGLTVNGNATTTNLTITALGSSQNPCLEINSAGVVGTTTCASTSTSQTSGSDAAVATVGGILGGFRNSATVPIYLWPSTNGPTYPHLPTGEFLYSPYVNISSQQSHATIYNIDWSEYDENNGFTHIGGYGLVAVPPNSVPASYGAHADSDPQYAGESIAAGLQLVGSLNCSSDCATIGGFAFEVVGSHYQPLIWGLGGRSIASSTTVYGGPSQSILTNVQTESDEVVPVPFSGTLSDLCISGDIGTQSGAPLVATVDVNSSPTALSITIPANDFTSAGWYCDHTDSIPITAGQYIDISMDNESSSTSPTFNSISLNLAPNSPATALIIFPAEATIGSTPTAYLSPYFDAGFGITTEAKARAPMPRAGIIKNLTCLYNTPPSSGAVVTFYKNGSPTSLAVTIPSTGSGLQSVVDSSDSVSMAAGDLFDLQINATTGTFPTFSSCSVEVD